VCVSRFTFFSFADNLTSFSIVAGPGNKMWFAEADSIQTITLDGAIADAADSINGVGAAVTMGPNNTLWFTKTVSVGYVDVGGQTVQFDVSQTSQFSQGIALGPDGNIWFAEPPSQIGRITPSGALTEFSLPTPGSTPAGIITGRDGNLWFTESDGNQIGRISPAGVVAEFLVPTANANPKGIAAGADGNLWFTEDGYSIGRVTPHGDFVEYAMPGIASIGAIIAGPDGALWFPCASNNLSMVCRITTSGALSEFPFVSVANGPAESIAVGWDGNLWLAGPSLGAIGRFNPP
jgi:virginiamycin B lyase